MLDADDGRDAVAATASVACIFTIGPDTRHFSRTLLSLSPCTPRYAHVVTGTCTQVKACRTYFRYHISDRSGRVIDSARISPHVPRTPFHAAEQTKVFPGRPPLSPSGDPSPSASPGQMNSTGRFTRTMGSPLPQLPSLTVCPWTQSSWEQIGGAPHTAPRYCALCSLDSPTSRDTIAPAVAGDDPPCDADSPRFRLSFSTFRMPSAPPEYACTRSRWTRPTHRDAVYATAATVHDGASERRFSPVGGGPDARAPASCAMHARTSTRYTPAWTPPRSSLLRRRGAELLSHSEQNGRRCSAPRRKYAWSQVRNASSPPLGIPVGGWRIGVRPMRKLRDA